MEEVTATLDDYVSLPPTNCGRLPTDGKFCALPYVGGSRNRKKVHPQDFNVQICSRVCACRVFSGRCTGKVEGWYPLHTVKYFIIQCGSVKQTKEEEKEEEEERIPQEIWNTAVSFISLFYLFILLLFIYYFYFILQAFVNGSKIVAQSLLHMKNNFMLTLFYMSLK